MFKLPAPPAHGENVITLTSGELTSKGDVTIVGPGAGKLIVSGNGTGRVFDIDDGSTLTDSPATITGLSDCQRTRLPGPAAASTRASRSP